MLFEGQSITDTIKNLDIDKVINQLAKIHHKNYFSQSKNAFLRFCQFQNINLSKEAIEQIKELETKTHKKYRTQKEIDYQAIDRTIKHMKNQKFKLSYRLMLATGLRVAELSQLTSNDCTITDTAIGFSFIGKGGSKELVQLTKTEQPKFYCSIKQHIEKTQQSKKLFYSLDYLQTNAKKLGFSCHDLRRIFAKLEYQKGKSKEEVKEKLRHSSMKTTNRYLNSKIKL
jgi:integrase